MDETQQIDSPHKEKSPEIIQQGSNVLRKPVNLFNQKVTPKTSSVINNLVAQPIIGPTPTPETKSKEGLKDISNKENILQSPIENNDRNLPKGVVPIPKMIADNQGNKNENNEDKNIPEEINQALPNRYRSNIIENNIVNEKAKETKLDKPKSKVEVMKEIYQD